MKKLLLLEDESIMRETLHDFLESEGYDVSSVADGNSGLALLRDGCKPDLIILDMRMPLMDGWEFSKKLREMSSTPPPLFIMTAAVDASERASSIGAADFIEKPLILDELLNKVKVLIGSPES